MTRTGTLDWDSGVHGAGAGARERDLSTAVDLFSLGCVFYECLAGRAAVPGEHIAAVPVRILCEEPRPLGLMGGWHTNGG